MAARLKATDVPWTKMRVSSLSPPPTRPFPPSGRTPRKRTAKPRGKKPAVISPLALETVRRIDGLFEIERAINGQSPEKRKAVRQELSVPLVADLEAWMRRQRTQLSRGNDVAKAMDYKTCASCTLSQGSPWHFSRNFGHTRLTRSEDQITLVRTVKRAV
jgi:hypothetical protein